MTGRSCRMLRAPLAALALLALRPAHGAPTVAEAVAAADGDLAALAEAALPAYVFVGGGSGAIISPDGYVISNAHVIRGSSRWRIRTGAGVYHIARVVGSSPGTDLCLLKIEDAEDLPYLPLGDSATLAVGDPVVAIGNPFALGNLDGIPTVTLGVVSALNLDRPHAYDAIQTDTPINPGNSGGPLINLRGELIGVNAQIQTRFGLRQNTGVGYAISANQVRRFLPALQAAEGGTVKAGRLPGLTLNREAEAPATIEAVAEGSAAELAGLRAGDVVVGVDGSRIDNRRALAGVLGRYPAGLEVDLHVRRDDEPDVRSARLMIEQFGTPYVGIDFDPRRRTPLVIGEVEDGSPAAAAGLRPGDTLLGVGRSRIPHRRAYRQFLEQVRPGMTVPFVIRRQRENMVIQVEIAEVQEAADEVALTDPE